MFCERWDGFNDVVDAYLIMCGDYYEKCQLEIGLGDMEKAKYNSSVQNIISGASKLQ